MSVGMPVYQHLKIRLRQHIDALMSSQNTITAIPYYKS